jgi:PTS system nitrogen regulatory IIA component
MDSFINYTNTSFIKFIQAKEKFAAIEELAKVFENSDVCSDIPGLISALKEREKIMSTGIGFGIAIPHAKIPQNKNMNFAVGLCNDGIDFDSMDGKPVHLIILVAAGENQHKHYLSLMSKIMTVLKDNNIKDQIIQSKTPEEVMEVLKKTS